MGKHSANGQQAPGIRRLAAISLHTSPMAQPGTGDAGGMNVYIDQTSPRLAARGVEVKLGVSVESATLGFLVRMVANVAFVLVADLLLRREGGDIDVVSTLFFLGLISLITSLHDRYRPVLAIRVVAEREANQS